MPWRMKQRSARYMSIASTTSRIFSRPRCFSCRLEVDALAYEATFGAIHVDRIDHQQDLFETSLLQLPAGFQRVLVSCPRLVFDDDVRGRHALAFQELSHHVGECWARIGRIGLAAADHDRTRRTVVIKLSGIETA